MDVLYMLVPLSVVLVLLIGVVLWWFVRSGQFDDLEGPAYRVVMDDDSPVTVKPKEAAATAGLTSVNAVQQGDGDTERN